MEKLQCSSCGAVSRKTDTGVVCDYCGSQWADSFGGESKPSGVDAVISNHDVVNRVPSVSKEDLLFVRVILVIMVCGVALYFGLRTVGVIQNPMGMSFGLVVIGCMLWSNWFRKNKAGG